MKERQKQQNTEKYHEVNKEIQRVCREAQEEWWYAKCKEIENLEKKHKNKKMYDTVKEMTRKKEKFPEEATAFQTETGKCQ